MKMTDDVQIARILTDIKTIALVGWSPKPDRPSHRVAAYLAARGYRVIPVNPGQAGEDSGLGEVVRASLTEVGPEFYGISDEQHLRKMALQKKLGGLRPFRARDSRDAPLLVKVDNLAEDLDRRSIAARD
jgi:hypothetical protein